MKFFNRMKKLILFICLGVFSANWASAQSRKYVSQFNQFQSYFNPGLTGYEGSTFRGFVRNQWAGFEGAPKTYFVSLEINPSEIKGSGEENIVEGKNAIGVNLVKDQYGPFKDTEMVISYASRIRVGKSSNLRLGAAMNYSMVGLDGNNLTTEQADDPTVNQFLNSFANMTILDFNLGMALTSQNYYFSYAAHNLNRGGISSGDIFLESKPLVSIFQTGFRHSVTPNVSIFSHVMYRIQSDLPSTMEFNIKALLMEKVWVGVGHRIDYAFNMQLGYAMPKFKFGYAYEMPVSGSYLIPNPTHEFMLSYYLFRKSDSMRKVGDLIW